MGRTINIQLSDAQHAALSAEVSASGEKFFDYCRNKLLADAPVHGRSPSLNALPKLRADDSLARGKSIESDRFARLEQTVERLVEMMGQTMAAEPDDVRQAMPGLSPAIDIDSMVETTLADAEQRGLTERVFTEEDREMAIVGVRSIGQRRAPPFSPGTQPQHLR